MSDFEKAVEAAYEVLLSEGHAPFMARVSEVGTEGLAEADREAEEQNRALVRAMLEAAGVDAALAALRAADELAEKVNRLLWPAYGDEGAFSHKADNEARDALARYSSARAEMGEQ